MHGQLTLTTASVSNVTLLTNISMWATISRREFGNLSTAGDNYHHGDFWRDENICQHLDNVTNTHVKVTCGLDLYLPPFLFVTGLVSNIFVILVMRSIYFRSLSTSFYMIVNAVTDSASIFLALPVHYIAVNFPKIFDGARHAHPMCSFFNVFGWGTSDLGILFTVAMTTERAIAIKYPLKAYKLCTVRRAKFVVIGLIVFEAIKLSHLAVTSRVVSNTTSRLCDVDLVSDAAYAEFYLTVWPWLHFAVLIASYLLVIAGNVIIIINIRKSTQGEVTNGIGRKSVRRESKAGSRNRQLSVMLVVDSFSLVLCTLPFGITNIMILRFGFFPDLPGGKNLAFTATFYLLYLNRCLNFFLYCISGSRFRKALKKMFVPASGLSLSDRHTSREVRTGTGTKRNTIENGPSHTLISQVSTSPVTVSEVTSVISVTDAEKKTHTALPNLKRTGGSSLKTNVSSENKTSDRTSRARKRKMSRPRFLTAPQRPLNTKVIKSNDDVKDTTLSGTDDSNNSELFLSHIIVSSLLSPSRTSDVDSNTGNSLAISSISYPTASHEVTSVPFTILEFPPESTLDGRITYV